MDKTNALMISSVIHKSIRGLTFILISASPYLSLPCCTSMQGVLWAYHGCIGYWPRLMAGGQSQSTFVVMNVGHIHCD